MTSRNPLDGDRAVDSGRVAGDGIAVVAFDANGIQYAPAAGCIVAEQLAGREPDLPVAGIAFGRKELDR